ncbi:CotH kinase family protein [Cellulophaga sp. F20128]|uniref:CotH kinase family protein n=1 Tax=Cellulophaga sp. F20128 TaxID=2926413 RepID=UPI001FF62E83|nr:CotH kinase family protein [Cellulophaga sp. F20128]MCK0156782.1 CotH kinase family protein [Cellulophaga sp. F20128]
MKNIRILVALAIPVLFLFSCSKDEANATDEIVATEEQEVYEETYADADFEATDWTVSSHSKDGDPNFDEVFEDAAVKRLDIVITAARWQSMLDDMTETYGQFGGNTGGNAGGGPPPGGNGGGAGLIEFEENPIFVPAQVFYEGNEWYKVGVRFKGNSSLQSSWSGGILKLSMKLDFDEFEDYYPQIKNQRFYGFKKLSLKNNYLDKSMLREKVAADVFRNAGLASSHTAFYTVYVDHGEGPIYFGVYTLVEEVDDTVIDTQFSSDNGNLYKPDGTGASFAVGTFSEDVFVKKTNEDEADFTDIQSLFEVLHAENRTSDPEAWRSNLEAIFDTDTFLNYLAVNTVIQNWDTYGRMTHNYFLYNSPDTEQLTWIPWDNNEALQDGNMEGSLALDFTDLNTTEWPLIGYLYQDATYKATYDAYVQNTIETSFESNSTQTTYATYASLLEPYATTEVSGYTFLNSSSDFQAAVSELNNHATARAAAATNYLQD